MSMELCILASGSSGNCTAVRTPAGVMLIDLGLGPRSTAQRLAGTGVSVADVAAVCLTHLDHDHFNRNWVSTLCRRGIRVFCHRGRVEELLACADNALLESLVEPFDGEPFEPLPGIMAEPVPLAHDDHGSQGFVLDGFGCRAGYATDLGHVPPRLGERFADLDLLAIESNYDPAMQRESGRPWFLQQRITGGRGHLSNEQALQAVRHVLDRCQRAGSRLPAHIVLLHRSLQCNCPSLVRRLFSRDMRIAPRLVLAEQFERSSWLRPANHRALTGEQLMLGWG